LSLFASIRNAPKEQSLIFVVIILAIGFNVATIRTGHHWEGDFALYTAHAKNIVGGKPFADTGYIFNPDRPFLSPKSYPPVYPVFLAPVYKIFGLDIRAIKIANISVFALFLLIFQHYVRKRLRYPISQLAVVTAVAFSPWFWDAKDRIQPDFLFMFFIYGAILLIDSAYTPGKTNWHRYLLAIFTGLIAYLAYGTRSLGLALIPALILSDLIRLRLISRFTLIAIAVFVLFYSIQYSELNTDQSYISAYQTTIHNNENNSDKDSISTVKETVKPMSFNVKHLLRTLEHSLRSNLETYHQAMSAYWLSNVNNTVDNAVYVTMGLLAITGFLALVLRFSSSGDYLILTYASVLLLAPFVQIRYLLPLIPLYLIYIFHGLETMIYKRTFISERIAYSSILGLLLVITLSNIGTYTKLSFDDITNGVDKKESLELFEFIRQDTPENSVLIASKPRLLALFTDRKSSLYAWPDTSDNLLDYFDRINATHVVVASKISGINENREFADWVWNNPGNFELIFENPDFRVYRIRRK